MTTEKKINANVFTVIRKIYGKHIGLWCNIEGITQKKNNSNKNMCQSFPALKRYNWIFNELPLSEIDVFGSFKW